MADQRDKFDEQVARHRFEDAYQKPSDPDAQPLDKFDKDLAQDRFADNGSNEQATDLAKAQLFEKNADLERYHAATRLYFELKEQLNTAQRSLEKQEKLRLPDPKIQEKLREQIADFDKELHDLDKSLVQQREQFLSQPVPTPDLASPSPLQAQEPQRAELSPELAARLAKVSQAKLPAIDREQEQRQQQRHEQEPPSHAYEIDRGR